MIELPITKKEFEYIIDKIKGENKTLYNKLWSHWFKLKQQKDK